MSKTKDTEEHTEEPRSCALSISNIVPYSYIGCKEKDPCILHILTSKENLKIIQIIFISCKWFKASMCFCTTLN